MNKIYVVWKSANVIGEEKNHLVLCSKDYIPPLSPSLLHISTYVKVARRNALGENTFYVPHKSKKA